MTEPTPAGPVRTTPDVPDRAPLAGWAVVGVR
jgi:hypothetical protein